MRRWLYDHPYAACWFSMAFCAVLVGFDVGTQRWFSAASNGFCVLFLGVVIWYYKRRNRRLDAEIRELEARSAELRAHIRASRGGSSTRNPEGP